MISNTHINKTSEDKRLDSRPGSTPTLYASLPNTTHFTTMRAVDNWHGNALLQKKQDPPHEPYRTDMDLSNTAPVQRAAFNHTGLSDNLKSGIEQISGLDMSDIRVHRNSNEPSKVGALAFTQGSDIHVAPGQEKHLPHESWHAVQQKLGRVEPTTQASGVPVNDDVALEKEADEMGMSAASLGVFQRKVNNAAANKTMPLRPPAPSSVSQPASDVPFLQRQSRDEGPKWEEDYVYYQNHKEQFDLRMKTLKEQGWEVKSESIQYNGKPAWQVYKRKTAGTTEDEKTPRKDPSMPPDVPAGWTLDASGPFKKKADAEKRRDTLLVHETRVWKAVEIDGYEIVPKGATSPVKQYRIRTQGRLPKGTKSFVLSFDDGPHVSPLGKGINNTEKVLDALKSKGVKAIFFVETHVSFRGGDTTGRGRALIGRMLNEGHDVGIHTAGTVSHESHPDALKAGRLESELESGKTRIEQYGAAYAEKKKYTPTWVRAPFGRGSDDPKQKEVYKKAKLKHLYWDIEGDKEPNNTSVEQLRKQFDKGLEKLPLGEKGTFLNSPYQKNSPHIVILYHDIRIATASAIGKVIDHIFTRVKGATFKKP